MEETAELDTRKTRTDERIMQKLGKIRQFCLETAGFILVVDPFERGREMAMKGYADLISGQHKPPLFTPPEGSLWYHVGDFWDGYFYTALVYWGLTIPSLILSEKLKYHGESRFSPENIRLLTAFSMVIAGVVITEIQDPKDIPAGVLGAAVFIALHLSAEKVAAPIEKASKKAIESLSKIAEKISTLT